MPPRVVDQPAAERESTAAARSAARREAVAALRLAASIAAYSAEQVADGLDAEHARAAVSETAAELAAIASALRRLAVPMRLGEAEGRALAVRLAASGSTR